MKTEWEFLEPWRAALRDSLIHRDAHATESPLTVSFVYPDTGSCSTIPRKLYLGIPGDTRSRRDATGLKLLREATELFTLLSLVNNEAFIALMNSSTGTHPVRTNEHQTFFPRWELRLIGNLSPNDAAVVQPQVTWGALLGFPDDPWGYSADFRAAAQQLEAMGVEGRSINAYVNGGSRISWTCRLQDSVLDGTYGHEPFKRVDPSDSIRDQFRRLFDVVVPPIVLACAARGWTTPVNYWKSPRLVGGCVAITAIRNWSHPAVSELTTALAMTAISDFSIDVCSPAMISREAMVKAGFLLNRLVCGNAVRLISENRNNTIQETVQVAFGKLALWGFDKLCNRTFTAVCTAVAESSVEAHLVRLVINLERSGRWSWPVYALCCGGSDVIPSVEIWRGTLTKSDILAISTVLQTQYPQPILGTAQNDQHQYGFVDFQEGHELQLCGADDG